MKESYKRPPSLSLRALSSTTQNNRCTASQSHRGHFTRARQMPQGSPRLPGWVGAAVPPPPRPPPRGRPVHLQHVVRALPGPSHSHQQHHCCRFRVGGWLLEMGVPAMRQLRGALDPSGPAGSGSAAFLHLCWGVGVKGGRGAERAVGKGSIFRNQEQTELLQKEGQGRGSPQGGQLADTSKLIVIHTKLGHR